MPMGMEFRCEERVGHSFQYTTIVWSTMSATCQTILNQKSTIEKTERFFNVIGTRDFISYHYINCEICDKKLIA